MHSPTSVLPLASFSAALPPLYSCNSLSLSSPLPNTLTPQQKMLLIPDHLLCTVPMYSLPPPAAHTISLSQLSSVAPLNLATILCNLLLDCNTSTSQCTVYIHRPTTSATHPISNGPVPQFANFSSPLAKHWHATSVLLHCHWHWEICTCPLYSLHHSHNHNYYSFCTPHLPHLTAKSAILLLHSLSSHGPISIDSVCMSFTLHSFLVRIQFELAIVLPCSPAILYVV